MEIKHGFAKFLHSMERLHHKSEKYAEAHELRYNTTTSEMMVFEAGKRTFSKLPAITQPAFRLTLSIYATSSLKI